MIEDQHRKLQFDMFLIPFFVCTCISVWSQAVLAQVDANDTTTNAAFGPLKFRDNGTFQISVFEDLHFGESK